MPPHGCEPSTSLLTKVGDIPRSTRNNLTLIVLAHHHCIVLPALAHGEEILRRSRAENPSNAGRRATLQVKLATNQRGFMQRMPHQGLGSVIANDLYIAYPVRMSNSRVVGFVCQGRCPLQLLDGNIGGSVVSRSPRETGGGVSRRGQKPKQLISGCFRNCLFQDIDIHHVVGALVLGLSGLWWGCCEKLISLDPDRRCVCKAPLPLRINSYTQLQKSLPR